MAGTVNINLPPNRKAFQVHSECKLEQILNEPVNVLLMGVHAHRLGRRIFVEIIRSNGTSQLIPSEDGLMPTIPMNATNFWSQTSANTSIVLGSKDYHFDAQDIFRMNQRVTLFRNDTIHTYCEYDTTSKTGMTDYSFSTSEGEMCQVYLSVFPVSNPNMKCKDLSMKSDVKLEIFEDSQAL